MATAPHQDATAYPLSWPSNWPRSKSRTANSRFSKVSVPAALDAVENELRRLSAQNVVISSNVTLSQRSPNDPGVAVYFNLRSLRCALACDRWTNVAHNLWAIAKHIEALRGQDRWGVGSIDQAFAGYAALPAPSGKDAWTLLGLRREGATREKIMAAYRALAPTVHPDTGGNADAFRELTQAKDLAIANLPS